MIGDAKWKHFERTGARISAHGPGDYLLKLDRSPKNESLDTPPLTITGPHDVQPQPLDVGVHEESEDEP
jgi:hypothetical protein